MTRPSPGEIAHRPQQLGRERPDVQRRGVAPGKPDAPARADRQRRSQRLINAHVEPRVAHQPGVTRLTGNGVLVVAPVQSKRQTQPAQRTSVHHQRPRHAVVAVCRAQHRFGVAVAARRQHVKRRRSRARRHHAREHVRLRAIIRIVCGGIRSGSGGDQLLRVRWQRVRRRRGRHRIRRATPLRPAPPYATDAEPYPPSSRPLLSDQTLALPGAPASTGYGTRSAAGCGANTVRAPMSPRHLPSGVAPIAAGSTATEVTCPSTATSKRSEISPLVADAPAGDFAKQPRMSPWSLGQRRRETGDRIGRWPPPTLLARRRRRGDGRRHRRHDCRDGWRRRRRSSPAKRKLRARRRPRHARRPA